MRDGGTRRNLIPTKVKIPTFTPAANAEIHNPIGTKVKNNDRPITINKIINTINNGSISFPPYPFFK